MLVHFVDELQRASNILPQHHAILRTTIFCDGDVRPKLLRSISEHSAGTAQKTRRETRPMQIPVFPAAVAVKINSYCLANVHALKLNTHWNNST